MENLKVDTIELIEKKVCTLHPSWNNERIRNKAVRMFYLKENL